MREYRLSVMMLAVCGLLLPGCAKKASDEIDFGTVQNSVYQNKYFGFKLTLPADWSVQDQQTRQQLAEAGTKMLVGDDAKAKALIKASEQQTVNLLAAFKHPVGTPVPFNPNVIGVAERLGGLSGVKTGKDYHAHARKMMESADMRVQIAKDLTVEKLGGIDFDVMHGSITVGPTTVQQKYYATVIKNYALVFISSYNDDNQQAAVQDILRTLAFQPDSGKAAGQLTKP